MPHYTAPTLKTHVTMISITVYCTVGWSVGHITTERGNCLFLFPLPPLSTHQFPVSFLFPYYITPIPISPGFPFLCVYMR